MISQRLNNFSNAINLTFVVAVLMIITSIVLPLVFREEIISIGQGLLMRYRAEQNRFHPLFNYNGQQYSACIAGLDIRCFGINAGL